MATKKNFNVKATEKPEKEKIEKEKIEKASKSNLIEEANEEAGIAAPPAKKVAVNLKKALKQ